MDDNHEIHETHEIDLIWLRPKVAPINRDLHATYKAN